VARNEDRIQFESGDLRLEGMLHRAETPVFAAVVLHPHPLYGGDMDNHVVTSMCDAMSNLGAATLRFNFRGAGASEGEHDNGRGERDDALSAITLLREVAPRVPLVLSGYSFGAIVAASVALDAHPGALLLVSPPAAFSAVPDPPADVPALIITGADDQVAPATPLQRYETANHEVSVIPGADHSWWGKTGELNELVTAFLGARLHRP
jgi:alpha/beta superfamily hydrolase